jgi:stearoyl-CoA desaturase (delta-9 desaturase)
MSKRTASPTSDVDLEPTPTEPLSFAARAATLAAVILPFLGLLASVVFLWGWGFSWVELVLLAGMYALTALGITVGYHRLFTHHSFETNPVVKCILGICGAMAVQGTLLRWVAFHRRHHQHSDRDDDPHSPHHHGKGVLGILRGLWHAHIGWMFKGDPELERYVRDLRQSKLVRVLSRLFPVWVLLGLLIPTGLGYLLWGSWLGAVLGLIWGGLVRIFFVHHVTWSVNSICHLWGRRPFPCRDESRNNFVVGVLALGEGWHNNHHAFPTSARHGFRWWEIDLSYWVIRMFVLLRLAWDVKLPGNGAVTA